MIVGLAVLLLANFSSANGINRNGSGARSMAMGGASVADRDDYFASMALNPSLLSYVDGVDLSIGVVGALAEGTFDNGSDRLGYLDDRGGAFPEVVLRSSLGSNLGLGFSLVPEEIRIADWVYEDLPGGIDGDTSYGSRTHRSEILGVRAAVGLGWQVTDTLSIGVSGGAVYNQNRLKAPYIFQSHPALAGFKTLLDLETDGVGLNGDIGLTWEVTKSLTVGLSYRTPTRISTEGTARGDIGEQLASLGLDQVPSTFAYRAEVENEFPQSATGGISWQVTEKTRVAFQVDWIGWERAFDNLTVNLSDGTNESINGLLGSDEIVDSVPLDWDDQFVYRAGIEHRLSEEWALRLGYSYGKAPMPTSTTTPMTAAISEHTVGVGVGYARGPYRVDLSYQWDLPATQQLSDSRILSGEYKNSKVGLEAHWLALTVGYDF